MNSLDARQRRALAIFGVLLLIGLVYRFWPSESSSAVVVAPTDSVANAEKRLFRLRETAATVPAKEEILKKVSAELATREKGLINADTAAQAQAQLIQIVRRLGNMESPPIEIRATDLGGVQPFGDSYGEVAVSVQIECRIDQLVNLLAAIAAQPEMVSTSGVTVSATNVKEKTVNVRLTLAGVVPRKLVPVRKGTGA